MDLSWSAWVLIGCAIAALFAMAYGGIRAALAARVVKLHAEKLKTTSLIGDAAEVNVYAARINASLERIPALLARADVAIARIGQSIEELKMPEAMVALRLAGASLRLLFGRFPTPR